MATEATGTDSIHRTTTNTESQNRIRWYDDAKIAGRIKLVQDTIQFLIVVIGVPVGLYNYIEAKNKDREDAEWLAYEKMDDRYWTYERLAMDHPFLDVSDAGASDNTVSALLKPRNDLTSAERINERQFMLMLISMYERAFILYADKSTTFKAEQWNGWDSGLNRWIRKPVFIEAWHAIGTDFDTRFQNHVNDLMKTQQIVTARRPTP
jgi:hypothetical protein